MEIFMDDKKLICSQVHLRSSQDVNYNLTIYQIAHRNFQQSCATPKYINMRNRSNLECPPMASEINGLCLCPHPHSGPFCLFQCTFEQIEKGLWYKDCHASNICLFPATKYTKYCINTYHIPLLKEPIVASATSLYSANVSWLTEDFFNFFKYIITIRTLTSYQEQGDTEQSAYTNSGVYLENIPIEVTLTQMNQNGELTNLSFTPYTDYVLNVTLLIESQNHGSQYVVIGNATFTTTEAVPDPPQVTTATLSSKNAMQLDWILITRCPGLIIQYEIQIWCNNALPDNQTIAEQLQPAFDCRHNFNSSQRIHPVYIPSQCIESSDLKTRVSYGYHYLC